VKSSVYYLPERDGKNSKKREKDRMTQRKILVVEDEKDISDLVALHLSDLCDELHSASDGYEGMRMATADDWDLIILDLMIPGPDGLEICRALRRERPYQPVLMLTSKSSELDRILGLETGADDYITKPFSVLELVARVRAIFRRIENLGNAPDSEQALIAFENMRLDPARREVWLDEAPIDLTAREFDLLTFFARHPGRVFRRAELLDQVWGYGHEGYEHTVNSHINRLRAKIERDPSKPTIIETVWGVGYKFAPQTRPARVH
jgi:DNA-binding response OmpR family regulator